jgi:hypothetical protein
MINWSVNFPRIRLLNGFVKREEGEGGRRETAPLPRGGSTIRRTAILVPGGWVIFSP